MTEDAKNERTAQKNKTEAHRANAGPPQKGGAKENELKVMKMLHTIWRKIRGKEEKEGGKIQGGIAMDNWEKEGKEIEKGKTETRRITAGLPLRGGMMKKQEETNEKQTEKMNERARAIEEEKQTEKERKKTTAKSIGEKRQEIRSIQNEIEKTQGSETATEEKGTEQKEGKDEEKGKDSFFEGMEEEPEEEKEKEEEEEKGCQCADCLNGKEPRDKWPQGMWLEDRQVSALHGEYYKAKDVEGFIWNLEDSEMDPEGQQETEMGRVVKEAMKKHLIQKTKK